MFIVFCICYCSCCVYKRQKCRDNSSPTTNAVGEELPRNSVTTIPQDSRRLLEVDYSLGHWQFSGEPCSTKTKASRAEQQPKIPARPQHTPLHLRLQLLGLTFLRLYSMATAPRTVSQSGVGKQLDHSISYHPTHLRLLLRGLLVPQYSFGNCIFGN